MDQYRGIYILSLGGYTSFLGNFILDLYHVFVFLWTSNTFSDPTLLLIDDMWLSIDMDETFVYVIRVSAQCQFGELKINVKYFLRQPNKLGPT